MADLKISQLTALTAASAASTDVIPVVDTSATTTKKISLADVAEYVAGSTVITNLVPTDSDEVVEGSTNLFYTSARSGLKANLASPALTGVPTAPTAAASTSTTQVATTAFVLDSSQDVQFVLAAAIFTS